MGKHFNSILRKVRLLARSITIGYHEYFHKIKHFIAINDTQQLIASYLPES